MTPSRTGRANKPFSLSYKREKKIARKQRKSREEENNSRSPLIVAHLLPL
jgi:hypothetical protein